MMVSPISCLQNDGRIKNGKMFTWRRRAESSFNDNAEAESSEIMFQNANQLMMKQQMDYARAMRQKWKEKAEENVFKTRII